MHCKTKRKPDCPLLLFTLIMVLAGLILPCLVHAEQVTLAWDKNDPAPEGYRIFVAAGDAEFDYTKPAWQGKETTCTLPDLTTGSTYKFVARAYSGTVESTDSNTVVYTVPEPTQTVVYPAQPKTLIIRFGD